jgi:hypothetical protein
MRLISKMDKREVRCPAPQLGIIVVQEGDALYFWEHGAT